VQEVAVLPLRTALGEEQAWKVKCTVINKTSTACSSKCYQQLPRWRTQGRKNTSGGDQKYNRTIESIAAQVENSIARPRCEQLVPKSSGYENVKNSLQNSQHRIQKKNSENL
jgi:hypothetical protein